MTRANIYGWKFKNLENTDAQNNYAKRNTSQYDYGILVSCSKHTTKVS